MGKQPTIDDAIERALKRVDPNAQNARELDAAAVSRVLIKHWGDDAPLVLGRALELARNQVAKWRGDDEGPRGSVAARDLEDEK
jgi:hypothetical protein